MEPNNNYELLCQRVEQVDSEAARILREEAFNYCAFNPSATLATAFVWMRSPQGRIYWERINAKVMELILKEAPQPW